MAVGSLATKPALLPSQLRGKDSEAHSYHTHSREQLGRKTRRCVSGALFLAFSLSLFLASFLRRVSCVTGELVTGVCVCVYERESVCVCVCVTGKLVTQQARLAKDTLS